MVKYRLFIVFLNIAACSLILTGCSKKELEQAKAEATQAKLELVNTQGLLAKSVKEKESLQVDLDAVSMERDKLQGLVTSLTESRDTAMAKAKDAEQKLKDAQAALTNEIEAGKAEISSLMEKMKGLQTDKATLEATIKELQDKLKDIKLPSLPQV